MTPFPVGPPRIGGGRHGAVAQRQRIPFATGRSRVRIPPAPPDGSSRGAPDKAPVRTDSHHALEKAMGGTVTPRFLPRAGGGVSRSPVRIRLGALGKRRSRLPSGGPGGGAHGVMDASLCVGGAMASTAVSKTVDPGSSPGRRATPPSSFLAHRGFGSGGGWRRFRNVAQLAARAAGGREAAGSSPAIPTWENPTRPSLPA